MASARDRPQIDPALGLNLVATRTLQGTPASVTVVIPAHNEQDTITEVVTEARRGLSLLEVSGKIIVCASDCTDDTAKLAADAGAMVVPAPRGKGAAVSMGVAAADGEIICLIDGDMQYFGTRPLVTILVEPILHGTADATISDLYWRPLYPQLWLYGFFAPLAGALFPELLAQTGSTPWAGQRAAIRKLWPDSLPVGFTVDLELLFYWNEHATRLRPVLADDWINPQRPKPDLMEQEFKLIIGHALRQRRIKPGAEHALHQWFDTVHEMMATYQPDEDDPAEFEQQLLGLSLAELHRLADLQPQQRPNRAHRPGQRRRRTS
jgi:hypothetical protein